MEHEKMNTEETANSDLGAVRCCYNDVEKWCDKNGYYIGTYWFPNKTFQI